MVLQAIVEWTGPGATQKLNVFHYADTATGAGIKSDLEAWLNAIKPQISSQFSAKLQNVWRTYDTVTGDLTNEVAFSGGTATITGTSANQVLPDAVAGLFRWNTGVVVSGRFLKGRTFVPGLTVGLMTSGNFAGTGLTTLVTAAQTLAGSTNHFAVWSKKHGVVHDVNSGSFWAEASTQRRRRG